MVSQPQGNETSSLLLHGERCTEKELISQRLKSASLVLPLLRMHWVLLGLVRCWQRKTKMCVYFRAMGTKAAPGKGRELKPQVEEPKLKLGPLESQPRGFLSCSGTEGSLKAKRAEGLQA